MDTALLQHIEFLIGSIGVILGLFFAFLLLHNRQNRHKANVFLAIYLLAFSLRVGKSLFHNYFEIDATIRTLFLTALLCVGPSIWLYTSQLIKLRPAQRSREWLHYLPFFLLASCSWLIPNNGSWIFGVFYNFLIVHMFVYTLLSIINAIRSIDTSRLKENPELTRWVMHFLGLNMVFILLYFLISEFIIPFYMGISFLFSSVIIYLSFLAFRDPSLFEIGIEKYRQSTLSDQEVDQLIHRLKVLMENEKPYLDPSLKLSKLGAQLGVSSKVLSQAINQTESLNYSQFISRYRVQEVKRLMQLPSYANMTIAAMAYDSGFSSISTFNAAFKKHAGQTAKSYRKMLQQKRDLQ